MKNVLHQKNYSCLCLTVGTYLISCYLVLAESLHYRNAGAKVVQTEDKTKENLIFLCFVEVQPSFDTGQRYG